MIKKKESLPCRLSKPFLQRCSIIVGQPDAWIIDLREHSVYERSHIKGAVNVPYEELEGGYAFPKDKFLVFYCDRGGASMAAARELARRGYKTSSVTGGFAAYRGRNIDVS